VLLNEEPDLLDRLPDLRWLGSASSLDPLRERPGGRRARLAYSPRRYFEPRRKFASGRDDAKPMRRAKD
jgi:hypothetical protein